MKEKNKKRRDLNLHPNFLQSKSDASDHWAKIAATPQYVD